MKVVRNRALGGVMTGSGFRRAAVAACSLLSMIAVVKAEGIYPRNVSDKNSSTPQAPAPIVVAPGITLYPKKSGSRNRGRSPIFPVTH